MNLYLYKDLHAFIYNILRTNIYSCIIIFGCCVHKVKAVSHFLGEGVERMEIITTISMLLAIIVSVITIIEYLHKRKK